MPTVWIANDSGHDTSDAERFGEVKPLTIGNVNTLNFDRMNYHLARGIVKYVRPEDYLIISGSPMIPASAVLLWIMHHGKINILQWYAKKKRYVEFNLTLEQIKDLLNTTLIRP